MCGCCCDGAVSWVTAVVRRKKRPWSEVSGQILAIGTHYVSPFYLVLYNQYNHQDESCQIGLIATPAPYPCGGSYVLHTDSMIRLYYF